MEGYQTKRDEADWGVTYALPPQQENRGGPDRPWAQWLPHWLGSPAWFDRTVARWPDLCAQSALLDTLRSAWELHSNDGLRPADALNHACITGGLPAAHWPTARAYMANLCHAHDTDFKTRGKARATAGGTEGMKQTRAFWRRGAACLAALPPDSMLEVAVGTWLWGMCLLWRPAVRLIDRGATPPEVRARIEAEFRREHNLPPEAQIEIRARAPEWQILCGWHCSPLWRRVLGVRCLVGCFANSAELACCALRYEQQPEADEALLPEEDEALRAMLGAQGETDA